MTFDTCDAPWMTYRRWRRICRRIAAGDYVVFYHVDEERKTVEIHRAFRAASDLPQQLLDA
jgi:plasmid stabilization system protein ParE